MRSDAALLDAVARGSHQALAELHDRYSQPMWRLACLTVGSSRAVNVVIAAFVDVWRSPSERDDDSRGKSRQPVVCRLLDGVMCNSAPMQAFDGQHHAERLRTLTSHERAALMLILTGSTRGHAAAALGDTPAGIAALLRSGLERFSASNG